MKRTYKSVDNAAKHTSQFTAQELINGRMHHDKHGWIDITIKDEDNQLLAISLLLGGNKTSKINYVLKNRTPQHWGLKRVMYSKTRKGWSYYAGQDYPTELRQIRQYLYQF